MNTSDVPPAVAQYLEAEKAKDAERIAACFAPDALVRDEGGEYAGVAAIRGWWEEAQRKYRYVAEPLGVSRADDAVTVPVRLTGDFPGGVAEIDYRFSLAGDKIAKLIIE